MKERALIVFMKNPVKGRVKTRLAKDIGDEKALSLYLRLLDELNKLCQDVTYDVHLFFSNYIDHDSKWTKDNFTKHVQSDDKDLGERIINAFTKVFNMHYTSVCIIGSDCPYIHTGLLNEAYTILKDHSVVIGPAEDGGFYLYGCNSIDNIAFDNVTWSESNVCNKIHSNLAKKKIGYKTLDLLEDIDNEESYNNYLSSLQNVSINNL